jgi:ABC-type nitrate/sulfonate/bicarbonate transport system substrate-binding protein
MKAWRIVEFALLLWASVVFSWAAEGPSKAVFAYGAINAYMTTTWVAREQGFFRKHNVEVEPVFIIASRAAQSMLAGEVHVGLIGPTHVVNAVAAGGDLVMFLGNQNNVRYIMVVQPSVKQNEDLKGKRIAIGASQAGLASLATYAALDHMGLNARRDKIALLMIGEEPLRLAALQTGNVQATLIAPELANTATSQGFNILLDMAKLNIPFQATGMVTTRKLLRSDPLMLERVGRATVDAIKFIVAPTNKKTVLQIMAKNLKLAKPDRLEASYNDLVEELPRSICPTIAGVRSVMKFMAELGLNPKAAQIKTDEVVDLTLCKQLGGNGS